MSTPAPTTLMELFLAAETHCANNGNHAHLDQIFTDETITPSDAKKVIVSAPARAILTMILVTFEATVYPFFMPFRFERVGVQATPLDKKIFVFRGEIRVIQGLAPKLVLLDDDAFNKKTGFMLSEEATYQYFLDNPDAKTVDAVDATTTDATKGFTRHTMLCPASLMKLFWAYRDGGVPISTFWRTMFPIVRVDPGYIAGGFNGFMTHMRLAATAATATDADVSLLSRFLPGLADTTDAVDDLGLRYLTNFLPSLRSGGGIPTGGAQAQQTLIETMTGLMAQNEAWRRADKVAAEVKETLKEEKKLTAAYSGITRTTGTLLYQTPDVSAWPPKFTELAGKSAAAQADLITAEVRQNLLTMGETEMSETYVTSAKLAREVAQLNLTFDNSSLTGGGGLNPFNFVCEAIQQVQEANAQYQLFYETGTPNLAEAKQIYDMPLCLPLANGSMKALKRMSAAAPLYLKPLDPILQYLRDHINSMESIKEQWERYIPFEGLVPQDKSIYHLQYVALRLQAYIRRVTRGERPDTVGDPTEIATMIGFKQRWEPSMKDVAAVKRGLPTSTQGGAAAPAGGAGAGGGGYPGGSGERIPNPTASEAQKKGVDKIQTNEKFNLVLFDHFKRCSQTCRERRRLIAAGKLPGLPLSRIDNDPMCLAWHTKGKCNIDCPRKSDHVEYTAAQYSELAQWCTANYETEV